MFGLLIAGAALAGLASVLAFYYTYIASFHRVQVFGDRIRKPAAEKGVIPVFDLPDLLIDKDEYRLMRLVKLRKLPVVVCLGDSITQGVVSVDYVAALQETFKGRLILVNSGVNGNLAFNLLQRLHQDCLEYDPDFITILIGTNDVNAATGGPKALRSYQRFQGLAAMPDEAFYLENLRAVLEGIEKGTRARVALLSLPVIGEDPASPANALARRYSARIKELAAEHGFAYLPLNETQNAYLAARPAPPRPSRAAFLLTPSLMLSKGFDRIARLRGRELTYDGLHETTKGADMILSLIWAWLEKELAASFPAPRPPEPIRASIIAKASRT
jgi:lysophospholipase L1-like esterase